MTHKEAGALPMIGIDAVRDAYLDILAEAQRYKQERDEARADLMRHENDEASVCPEDVGFVEYIKALKMGVAREKERADSNWASLERIKEKYSKCVNDLKTAEAEVANLRQALNSANNVAEFRMSKIEQNNDAAQAEVARLRDALELTEGHLSEMLGDKRHHPIGHCPVLDRVREVLAQAQEPRR
jgi:DNA repair exonuclease SbcCD ATPase subunit